MAAMQFDYQLTQQDLAAYQYAVKDRLVKLSRSSGNGFSSMAAGLTAALFASGLAVALVLPKLSGHRLALEELFAGFFLGAIALLAANWLNYFHQRRFIVKQDGPALSRHSVTVEPGGLRISGQNVEHTSLWPLFSEVQALKTIIVLWIEPAQGIVIPKGAFANDVAAQEFLTNVSAHIANAKAASVL